MRFQERDGAILSMIYEYGGVLARRHIHQTFWPDATLRAVLKRLAKLVNSGYLSRPDPYQRKTQPIPEPVYWLAWKGILWVATQSGIKVDPPTSEDENQMRRLRQSLNKQGIHWLREPRWIQLAHDIAIIDIRLHVEQAVSAFPALQLERWVHETEFRVQRDRVSYQLVDPDGQAKEATKLIYPDSYFVIADRQRLAQGKVARARFLLELDHATHTRSRFGREKVAPGVAYIKSPEYKARFGANAGRWLVVTTGKTRRKHLMAQTKREAGVDAEVFLFTTFDHLGPGSVLTEPIWWQVGRESPAPLLPQVGRSGNGLS